MALETVWATPKDWTSEVLASSDLDTYVSQDLLYLYALINHFDSILTYDNAVLCHEGNVLFHTDSFD